MQIETTHLWLLPPRPEDIEAVAKLYSDPEVVQFLKNGKSRTLEETKANLEWHIQHWRKYGFGYWTMLDKKSSEFIGRGGLFWDNLSEVNIGYVLNKAWWGKGIATELVLASLEFGFKERGFERIVAVIHPENSASQRVVKKAGFQYEKTVYHNNQDEFYFVLTKEVFLR